MSVNRPHRDRRTPRGRVVVFGGSGFVGRHLVAKLVQDHWLVTVPSRHPSRHRDLSVLPRVDVLEADIHDTGKQRELLRDADAIINLVGILNESRHDGSGFRRAHTDLARNLAESAKACGVRRFVQMSALRADHADPPSFYLKSKKAAEEALRQADLDLTIFRPSVIFGADDNFINQFASLVRFAPIFPVARASARFAPVYVGDVVARFAEALDDRSTIGQAYDLCGPEEWTLAEIIEASARWTGRRTKVIGLPDGLGKLQARILEFAPGQPMSRDNFASLGLDSVCSGDTPTCTSPLSVLGPICLRPGRHETELQALRERYINRSHDTK
ncbi:MAG: complex I NDUFA9 subunit family protein [Thioalkalivibrionaceae bacterium]